MRCGTTRPHSASQSVRYDSVWVRETVRDTIVMIEPDSAAVRALLECDSIGQVRISQIEQYYRGRVSAAPSVAVKDNVLTAKVRTDTVRFEFQIRDRIENRSSSRDTTVRETIEVNRLNGWQRFWMRAGQAFGAVAVLAAGFKLSRLFRPKY